jgi:capsular exopolysaccharide synthesis family protein
LKLPANRAHTNLLSQFTDESPAGTEFRRLYLRVLKTTGGNGDSGCVMVTSARRGEGKSTTTSYLALTIARHGPANVLLVDCDLRKPRVHEIYGIPQARGMTDLLRGILPLKAVVKDTPQPNLKVITSGRVISGPSKLFQPDVIRRTFAEITAEYPLVIVDSPPVLPVSDPLLLAPEMDGVLLVVLAGKTPRQVVRRARDLLSSVEANILGVVVNNATQALPYYYDYKYYGYEEEVPRIRDGRSAFRGEVKLIAPQAEDRQ